jgi:hypothetical protein
LETVDRALEATRLLVVVCSPTSLRRPWINFEMGCAWVKRVPVLPICHSGQQKGQLSPPISTFQALEMESPNFVPDFLTSVARHLQLGAVPRIDRTAMSQDLEQACRACSVDAPIAGPVVPPPSMGDLDPGEVFLLQELVEHDDRGCTIDDLATASKLKTAKVNYHIDKLVERKLVTLRLFMNAPARYTLSSAGRKYLVDAGLL